MSEANKTVARRFLDEVCTRVDMSALSRLVADDFVFHGFLEDQRGHEGLKKRMAFLRDSFPDGRYTIDDVIAEGDKVAYRFAFEGTHKGAFLGMAATGKRVAFEGITIVRIADGKVVEHWGYFDLMAAAQQVGKAI